MNVRVCAIIFMLILLFSVPLAPSNNISGMGENVTPKVTHSTSSTFSSTDLWDGLYSNVNTTDLMETVRILSEDYPSRTWNNYTDTPSPNLEGAWQFVMEKLETITGGQLEFHFYTEKQTLVAIKNGTNNFRAPIVIGGSIASGGNAGANAYAASAAAVLETAKLLNSVDMTNDVYFILVNTVSTDFDDPSGQAGMRTLLEYLDMQDRTPAVCIWFSYLLYQTILVHGDQVLVRSEYTGGYEPSDYLASIAALASTYSGSGQITFDVNQGSIWEHSGGYDAVMAGIPTLTLSQYYLDYYTGTIYDTWDQGAFTYSILTEASGVAACITAYLGQLGYGEAPNMTVNQFIPQNSTQMIGGQFYGASGQLNLSISWTGTGPMPFKIYFSGGPTLVWENTSASPIVANITIAYPGWYFITVENTYLIDADVTVTYSYFGDFDGDTLNDRTEYEIGTDCLSRDTDQDGLDDWSELILGTIPTNPDFDGDGLKDGIEIAIGTSPFNWDTDNDTLSDSEEVALGTNPLSNDTDQDGLLDPEELALTTNPLSPDTDFDTLTDFDEIYTYFTSPISNDTDLDTMNDGWEVMYNLNPLSAADANDDNDNDTLVNSLEFALGTSPLNNDTDYDLMSDPWEYEFGLDPTSSSDANEDMDGDGLVNWKEFEAGTYPNVTDCDHDGLSDLFEVVNGLNPWSADSDGDGLSDYYEIQHDLMPLDPDTDHDGIIDSVDWAPREPWIDIVPPVSLTIILGSIIIWLWIKRRNYMRGADI